MSTEDPNQLTDAEQRLDMLLNDWVAARLERERKLRAAPAASLSRWRFWAGLLEALGWMGGAGCGAAVLAYQFAHIDATPMRIAHDHPLLAAGWALGWFIAWVIGPEGEGE